MIYIEGGRGSLYQWDIDQRLIIEHDEVTEVHFSNNLKDPALICEVYEEGGLRYANVPNILLQQPATLLVHGCCEECVRESVRLRVIPRAKPADYVYTETELLTFEKLQQRAEAAVVEAETAATQAAKSAAEAAETLENIPADYAELAVEVGKLSEEKVSYELRRGNNLVDESTFIRGSWWVESGVETNQYTGNYWACEVDVTGLDEVTIKAYLPADATTGVKLYNFYTVVDDVVSNATLVDSYLFSAYTITLPAGATSLRFNLFAKFTGFPIMLNAGGDALPYEPYAVQKVIPGVTEIDNLTKRVDDLEKINPGTKAVRADQVQMFTTTEQQQARENIGLDISAVTVVGINLCNPADTVDGAWWYQGKLQINQYTSRYSAAKANVAELSTISLRMISSNTSINTVFYSYYFVDADENVLATERPNVQFFSKYVLDAITVPDGAQEFRFCWQRNNTTYTVDAMVVSGESAPEFEPYESINCLYSERLETAQSRKNAEDIATLRQETDDVINTARKEYCRIVLGDNLVAIVGDTLQVFYNSIVEGDYAGNVLKLSCPKGKCYPRYWEYTPTATDVGEYTMTIEVYDMGGNILASSFSTLQVVAAENPSSVKHVLCVGDSTTEGGQIPIEASRRIKGTSGAATSPSALALSNISFVGRKHGSAAGDAVGWEGTGGWTYSTYNSTGVTAIRFTVEGGTDLNIGGVYQVGNFKLQIAEINVTNGSGVIRCTFYYETPYASAWDATAQSGTMTKTSSNGQDSIAYTAWVKESFQPFWSNNAGAFDILTYRDTYCGGQIDAICVLLGVNSLVSSDVFVDVSTVVESAKTFCRNIHGQLPNCKLLVSTVPLASVNGGIAANYGSSSKAGMYNANGMNHKIFSYNAALIEAMRDDEFAEYVTVISSHAQFDAENGYPTTQKALNARISTKETLQSNAVHPRNEGYWQLSDALAFRAVLGSLVE